ncbi:hypothetical protein AMECASPLE_028160 [Ameca splendens]|uniref:Uncharacterized protein n=1 Tax=Ameca splendens TaxID=208324 RepID=A0ABV0YGW5_9TELE
MFWPSCTSLCSGNLTLHITLNTHVFCFSTAGTGNPNKVKGRIAEAKCKHTLTTKGNLEKQINLKHIFLDCGWKLKDPERTHTGTGRTSKLHAEGILAKSRTQDIFAA